MTSKVVAAALRRLPPRSAAAHAHACVVGPCDRAFDQL